MVQATAKRSQQDYGVGIVVESGNDGKLGIGLPLGIVVVAPYLSAFGLELLNQRGRAAVNIPDDKVDLQAKSRAPGQYRRRLRSPNPLRVPN